MKCVRFFFACWEKHKQQRPLEPLEAQLLEVILLHPELHSILENPTNFLAEDFHEGNPFLHLGLHIALREQVSTNRPAGIQAVYAKLCRRFNDVHAAEHKMIDCLSEILWQAQQTQTPPNEQYYLALLKQL